MTDTALSSVMIHFSREQLEAIDKILKLLDPEEFRDYHGQFGACNAPDMIELLRNELRNALDQVQKDKGKAMVMVESGPQVMR
ncbi:MAG: hypothetical protein C4K48_12665 [Candidatus Thorarchaeota archaeon]|nr:MAG: hypothetical protein C4K48_12665 [Candidatus Thorarchaeota archaeon]